jgi:hypothetical protein
MTRPAHSCCLTSCTIQNDIVCTARERAKKTKLSSLLFPHTSQVDGGALENHPGVRLVVRFLLRSMAQRCLASRP